MSMGKILDQLRREHDLLAQAISALETLDNATSKRGRQQGRISAAGRRRISEAAKARWAKVKKTKGEATTSDTSGQGKRRTLSAAAKRRISEAQKARWARRKKAA